MSEWMYWALAGFMCISVLVSIIIIMGAEEYPYDESDERWRM